MQMGDKKENLWFLFQFLHEVEKKLSKEEEKVTKKYYLINDLKETEYQAQYVA